MKTPGRVFICSSISQAGRVQSVACSTTSRYVFTSTNTSFLYASAQQTLGLLCAGQENPFIPPCEAKQLVLTQDGENDTSFDVSDCKYDRKFDLTLGKSRTGQIKITSICNPVNMSALYTINKQTLLNDTILRDSVDCGSGQLYSNNQPLPATDVSSLDNDEGLQYITLTLTLQPLTLLFI